MNEINLSDHITKISAQYTSTHSVGELARIGGAEKVVAEQIAHSIARQIHPQVLSNFEFFEAEDRWCPVINISASIYVLDEAGMRAITELVSQQRRIQQENEELQKKIDFINKHSKLINEISSAARQLNKNLKANKNES